jgi:3-hydroxyacyl-[acyl-carrier-protein] dehydratase
MIVLREARNVKYGHFMEPGHQLVVMVEMTERNDRLASFKGKGEIEGNSSVSARITLETYNLRDQDRGFEAKDQKLIAHFRDLYRLLIREPQPTV